MLCKNWTKSILRSFFLDDFSLSRGWLTRLTFLVARLGHLHPSSIFAIPGVASRPNTMPKSLGSQGLSWESGILMVSQAVGYGFSKRYLQKAYWLKENRLIKTCGPGGFLFDPLRQLAVLFAQLAFVGFGIWSSIAGYRWEQLRSYKELEEEELVEKVQLGSPCL